MHAYNCHVVHACVNLHFACSTLRRCEHLFFEFQKDMKEQFLHKLGQWMRQKGTLCEGLGQAKRSPSTNVGRPLYPPWPHKHGWVTS